MSLSSSYNNNNNNNNKNNNEKNNTYLKDLNLNTYLKDLNLNLKIEQVQNYEYLCNKQQFHPDLCHSLKNQNQIKECQNIWNDVCNLYDKK
jgi:hypothetical protein